MRVWAARAVYGLALGGAVLFYCFYFGQLAWYVLMLAVCLPLFSLVVSLPAMLTAGIVLHAPAAVEREKTCVLQVYMLGWMPAARMEVRISVEDRTHPGQDCARWLHLRGEAPAEWELDTAHCGAACGVRGYMIIWACSACLCAGRARSLSPCGRGPLPFRRSRRCRGPYPADR